MINTQKHSFTCRHTECTHSHWHTCTHKSHTFSLSLCMFLSLVHTHTFTCVKNSVIISVPQDSTHSWDPIGSRLTAVWIPSCCRWDERSGRGVRLECQGQREVCAGAGMRWMGRTTWAEPGGGAPHRQAGAAALTPAGRWWHKSWNPPLGSSDSAAGLNEIYKQMRQARPTCETDRQVTQTNEKDRWDYLLHNWPLSGRHLQGVSSDNEIGELSDTWVYWAFSHLLESHSCWTFSLLVDPEPAGPLLHEILPPAKLFYTC